MQNLILLHGALGSSKTLAPLQQALAPDFQLHTFDFHGHGESPAQTFNMATLAEQVRTYIESSGLDRPHVFGYSMGGYVALYLAQQAPNLLGRIVTLGTKFNWTPEIAAISIRGLQADKIEEKVPKYAAYLASLHGETEWRELLQHTALMMDSLGAYPILSPASVQQISNPTLICLGEQDNMVSQEESEAIAQALPQGQFQILPQTQHPIQKVDPKVLAPYLQTFLV